MVMNPCPAASLVRTSRVSLGVSLTSLCAATLSTAVTGRPPGRRTRAASSIMGSGCGTRCRSKTIVAASMEASATGIWAASIQTAAPGRRTCAVAEHLDLLALTATW